MTIRYQAHPVRSNERTRCRDGNVGSLARVTIAGVILFLFLVAIPALAAVIAVILGVAL